MTGEDGRDDRASRVQWQVDPCGTLKGTVVGDRDMIEIDGTGIECRCDGSTLRSGEVVGDDTALEDHCTAVDPDSGSVAGDIVEEIAGNDIGRTLEEGGSATDEGRLVIGELAFDDLNRGHLGIEGPTDEGTVAVKDAVEDVSTITGIEGERASRGLSTVTLEGAAIDDDGSYIEEVGSSAFQARVIGKADARQVERDTVFGMDTGAELADVCIEHAIDQSRRGCRDQDAATPGKCSGRIGDHAADSAADGEAVEDCQRCLALLEGDDGSVAGSTSQQAAVDDSLRGSTGGAQRDTLALKGQVLEVGSWCH